MKFTSLGFPAALLAAASLIGGCQNTARGIEQDAEKNAAAARESSRDANTAASRAGEEIKDATRKVAEGTKEMAGSAADLVQEAANASRPLGDAMDAAQQTAEIKTALIADAQIDASGINVDTDAATRRVTLKGHVPSAAQKAAAERIAREKAPSYKVMNDLAIRARP